MTEEEAKKGLIYKNYAGLAGQIRGSLLNEIILLERIMDEYICSYFCETEAKKRELMAIIMCTEKMTFEGKRVAAQTIMKKRHPEITSKQQKQIFKDLEEINKERNMLAHYMLSFSPDSVVGLADEEFTLSRFKNEVVPEKFTKERCTALAKLINESMKIFIDLHPVFKGIEI